MKNLIIATTIALSTLASIGAASAGSDIYTKGYSASLQAAFVNANN